MKIQISGLLKATALTACMFTVLPNAFAESEADDPQAGVNVQIVTNEELQTRMLNTLENAQSIAEGIGMTEILGDQIKAARASVLSATPQELEAIPPSLYSSMKASTASAVETPRRLKNSRNGSTTASRKVRGANASSLTSGISSVVAMPTTMNKARGRVKVFAISLIHGNATYMLKTTQIIAQICEIISLPLTGIYMDG